MNLSNLEKILQNPDTELKAEIQNQMRAVQLQHEIDEAIKNHLGDPHYSDVKTGVKIALSTPSILRHCDPEIMKKSGWIRQEDYQKAIDGLKKCMDSIDFPRSFAQATLIDLKEL